MDAKELRLNKGLPALEPGLNLVISRPGVDKSQFVVDAVYRWLMEDGVRVKFNSLDKCDDSIEYDFFRNVPEQGLDRRGVLRFANYLHSGLIGSERDIEEFVKDCIAIRPDAIVVDGAQMLNVGILHLDSRMVGTFGAATDHKFRVLAWLGNALGVPVVATANLSRKNGFLYGCENDAPLDIAKTVVQLLRDGDNVVSVVRNADRG